MARVGAADSVDGVEEVESDFEVDPSWISGAGADSETSPLFPGSARGPSPKLRAAPRDQYRHGPSTVQAWPQNRTGMVPVQFRHGPRIVDIAPVLYRHRLRTEDMALVTVQAWSQYRRHGPRTIDMAL